MIVSCFMVIVFRPLGTKDRVDLVVNGLYLEDHPRTCKWVITMVIVSPLRIGLFPFQIGRFMAYKWG